jgi:hypothetical protein
LIELRQNRRQLPEQVDETESYTKEKKELSMSTANKSNWAAVSQKELTKQNQNLPSNKKDDDIFFGMQKRKNNLQLESMQFPGRN